MKWTIHFKRKWTDPNPLTHWVKPRPILLLSYYIYYEIDQRIWQGVTES